MNWSKLGRFFAWFGYNSSWYLMAALGAIAGISWAFHIFIFFAWLTLIFGLLMTWYKEHCKRNNEAYNVTQMPVPLWLDFCCDMALAIMLAATGHWFYAGMVIFNEVIFLDAIKSLPAPTVSS